MTKFNAKLLSPEAIAITRREPLTPTNHGVFMDPFFFKHSSLERLLISSTPSLYVFNSKNVILSRKASFSLAV